MGIRMRTEVDPMRETTRTGLFRKCDSTFTEISYTKLRTLPVC